MRIACAECGRAAVATLERDGVETHVCAGCLDALGPLPLLSAFVGGFRRSRPPHTSCPYCGTTEDELRSRGLAGCPLCYEALSDIVGSEFGVGAAPASGT